MNNKTQKIFFLFQILVFFQISIFGQDNTMYMLHQLPQANMLNPAVDFPCKFYIELPVVSSIKFAYNNTSFSYKDFIRTGTGDKADSLVMDFDNIYDKLHKNNAIRVQNEVVLLGSGFHWKKYFISARIYLSQHAGVFYNKDLVALKDGNWDPVTDTPVNFDLSRNEINEISYIGISLGISKQFSNELRLGGRLNYLKGMANVNMRQSDLNITTTEQPVTVNINTDYEVNASFPMEYERDSAGMIHSIKPVFDNFASNYIFNKNRGLAIDLGLVFDYSPKIKLSASILNLGFIRWKSNAINLKANGSIDIIGEDLKQFTNNQNTDLVQLLKDTIASSFHYSDTQNSYFTALPVSLFAGGTYQISNKLEFGLIGKLYIYNYATFPTLTATINVKPISFLNLTGSISYANRTLRNLGFAVILGNEEANFYFITDMLPVNYVQDTSTGAFFPYQSRSLNFRFGFNLMFGCKNYKKKSFGPSCPAYGNY